MLIAIIAVAVFLLIAGFEMFLVLGVPSLLVKEAYFAKLPDPAVVQKIFGGIDHTTLLAIPFFVLAANLMASGRIARDLTGLMQALLGHTRGGMGHVTVGGSMAFGAVSGSAPATVAALGGLVYPEMRRSGFSERFSVGLLASSAETALLIPPSITFIVYGWMTGTSIAQLFAGGLAVGLLLGLAFAIMVEIEARRTGVRPGQRTTARQRLAALRAALWAIGMPVIILGGIYSGMTTPTEAAVVSVVYAILVEMVVYRDIGMRKLFQITEEAAIGTTVIFILLAMGGLISYFVTLAQVPAQITALLQAMEAGPVMFLIIVNVLFLIAGMFIDPNSAMLILIPPLFPVAQMLGIDPVHFGMIVTLNISLGMITPPFGLDIFVTASTLKLPVLSVMRGVLPFIVVNLIVLLIVTYVPAISLFVPRLIFGG
ncbi:MAG: TRAP transporter large permease [Paracoccus denitrificans]|uniref:TRAP transporter large permease protein n=1 Tax=Paracoccus denitrificans TaxID=266 RepID=A0A533I7G5_PARDE|nr:MAG: TRAP transporter large permease [Paracoccus denitrificans]